MSRWREKKVDEDAATVSLGEDFEHARPMWNSEVTFILRNFIEQQQQNPSPSPLPPTQAQVLHDTLAYTSSLNQYASPEAVNAAHELMGKFVELSGWEMALINNCRIDDVDECISLLPTIRGKVERGEMEREKVEQLLAELKRFQVQ